MRYKNQVALIGLVCVASFVGCRSPLRTEQKQIAAVAAATQAIDKKADAIVTQAKGQVFASGQALSSDTNTSPALSLAKDFNTRAMLTLGPPDYADALDYTHIVSGLLSTNSHEADTASRLLASKDWAITGLQEKVTALRGKLETAEKKRDTGYAEAASEAETWARIKWWLWFAGWSLAGACLVPIVLKLAAMAFPMLAPIAGMVDAVAGRMAAAVFRLVPKAVDHAGVIARTTYDKVDETLGQVVRAVQDTKYGPSPGMDTLALELERNTNEKTRTVIREKKEELKIA